VESKYTRMDLPDSHVLMRWRVHGRKQLGLTREKEPNTNGDGGARSQRRRGPRQAHVQPPARTSHAMSTSATVLMFSTEECRRGKYSSMGSRAVARPRAPAWARLMPCQGAVFVQCWTEGAVHTGELGCGGRRRKGARAGWRGHRFPSTHPTTHRLDCPVHNGPNYVHSVIAHLV
jgi:hypothetical protein